MFEVLFSKFRRLLREDTDKSRLKVVKFFWGHIGTSFYSLKVPLRHRVPIFMFSEGPIGVPVFLFF